MGANCGSDGSNNDNDRPIFREARPIGTLRHAPPARRGPALPRPARPTTVGTNGAALVDPARPENPGPAPLPDPRNQGPFRESPDGGSTPPQAGMEA